MNIWCLLLLRKGSYHYEGDDGVICREFISWNFVSDGCLLFDFDDEKHFVKNVSSSLTELEWVRFSVFPLFTIIVLVALIMNFGVIQTERQGNLLVYIACGLLIINVMFFYLINDIMKREQQITEYRLFQQK